MAGQNADARPNIYVVNYRSAVQLRFALPTGKSARAINSTRSTLTAFRSASNAGPDASGRCVRSCVLCKRADSIGIMYRFYQPMIGTCAVVMAIKDGAVVGRL